MSESVDGVSLEELNVNCRDGLNLIDVWVSVRKLTIDNNN